MAINVNVFDDKAMVVVIVSFTCEFSAKIGSESESF
jgi:hypothetical protein